MNMGETKISIFKICFWLTIILGILKIAGLIDISNFMVFLPLIVGTAWFVFVVFLIGLISIYIYAKEMEKEANDEAESEEEA